MIRLLSHDRCPPGEFYYPKEGTGRNWPSTPLIHSLAAKVADYRIANKLPRADRASALADIDLFTCTRLKNNKAWCWDTETPIPEVKHAGGCATCGKK